MGIVAVDFLDSVRVAEAAREAGGLETIGRLGVYLRRRTVYVICIKD
jgi:hypothetical protein